MRTITIWIAALLVALLLPGRGLADGSGKPPLQVVPGVDLARYAGRWYEVARLPNRFQTRCAGEVTADYSLRSDGNIAVVNRCRLENNRQIEAKGLARLAGKGQPNSVLKVRFAPAFLAFLPQVWGDYRILALAADYSYALVGDPDRRYLWILSRSPGLDDVIYRQLVQQAGSQGFEVGRLLQTRQSGW